MVASLNGVAFEIDPSDISWDYKIHLADKPYLGGKVIQVFGASIGDITITGSFSGKDPLGSQLAMLKRMKELGMIQITNLRNTLNFQWPEQKLDMQVYLLDYGSPDGADSLVHDPAVFAPKWTLKLFPVTGTDQLKSAAVANFIDRLADGMGWNPGSYNGGTGNDIQTALAASGTTNLSDYVKRAFGISNTAAASTSGGSTTSGGPSVPSGPSTAAPTDRALTDPEIIKVASASGFVGNDLRLAAAIAKAESGLNPSALNNNASTGDYSVGLWQINMLAHKDHFGTEAELKIPERNGAAAFSLYQGRGGHFTDWSTYNHGTHLPFMAEMSSAASSLGL